jgi:hypothetical protein
MGLKGVSLDGQVVINQLTRILHLFPGAGMRDARNALQCRFWSSGFVAQEQLVDYGTKHSIKAITIEETGQEFK